jgi:hypothetical protein
MKIRLTGNGKIFTAETWEDLLKTLKDSTWFTCNEIEYMAGVNKRIMVLCGKEIEYSDAETFLKELARLNILEIEEG